MSELGKTLFFAGLVLSAAGGLLWLAGRWNLPHLPGDIRAGFIQNPDDHYHYPGPRRDIRWSTTP